jgi:X-X-X-Leu-X-X-Gly heptad repeat protein
MKFAGMVGMLALGLLGTGCATKNYVAKTIAPVETRVGAVEATNTDQTKQLSGHETQLAELDRDASRTKEKLNDTDGKATRAVQAAQAADQKATGAQTAADGAKQAADGAKTFAETGINRLGETVVAMNKFHVAKMETVLFDFNKDTLTTEAKAQLDALGKEAAGMERYMIEIQGFTDKTGNPVYNETLSEGRASAVARYLANEHQIPLHNISMLGSGYARPVADDKTREGRKMNRRVEVRIFVPESDGKVVVSGNR